MGEPQTFALIPGGTVTSPKGFKAGGVFAGIKAPGPGKLDLGMIASDVTALADGVFTTNKCAAAPVLLSRQRVGRHAARGIVFNSGNANACTGERGIRDAEEMARYAAEKIDAAPEEVLVASTGVIGVPLPMDLVRAGIEALELGYEGGHTAATAMLTTDTRTKEIAVETELGGRKVVVAGVAKGAAMVHPNLATMLAFITTDAQLATGPAAQLLRAAVRDSFNMISVDRDTSTNDTVLLLANGLAGNEPLVGGHDLAIFGHVLRYVCTYLAKQIVADAEGGTKVVEVRVQGALTEEDARQAARAVVSSNLVKAAIHGNDPNWGRILCALGYSGAEIDPLAVDLDLGPVPVVRRGVATDYRHEDAAAALMGKEVYIKIDLHLGEDEAVAWGCDLSEEYVTANSEYTT